MNYLFDITRNEASELHDVLGFVDADFSMNQVLPYLRSATKDIVEIIGENIYQKAVDWFEVEDENELVTLLRYSIGLGAFRKYAPLSDVSYTTNGRLFRSDENTKAAFEWMIDKSDDAMERSYYASIDEILRFIYSEMPDDSDEISKRYKLSDLYVYNLSVFQEFVNISDSYLLYFKLISELRAAQTRLLKPRMAQSYDIFKANEDDHINSLGKQICVYFAMKNGLRKESVQLWPKGVIRETSGSKKHQSASQLDIESSVLFYDTELDTLLKELENAISKLNAKPVSGPTINFSSEDKFITL